MAVLVLFLLLQGEGLVHYKAFVQWRSEGRNAELPWEKQIEGFSAKLRADGRSAAAVERIVELVNAHAEAELYDKAYDAAPEFNTHPNRLLVEAVEGLKPGSALDVGMGQGWNALFLAQKGWKVTGFDVSEAGLRKARERAASLGLSIDAVHASDLEFEFGKGNGTSSRISMRWRSGAFTGLLAR
jgi:2-polyprenyl-3-methyl-5-hydroxy-6-metoxy-1,4-benzoquinol methylase